MKYRPKRSIVFCSWGSEEHGLIGSEEFVEGKDLRSSNVFRKNNLQLMIDFQVVPVDHNQKNFIQLSKKERLLTSMQIFHFKQMFISKLLPLQSYKNSFMMSLK